MDFLYSIDVAVFYFFNHSLSSGFLDKFFSTITNVNNWYIAYCILLYISFAKGGKKGKIAAIGVIILIIISDQLSHKVIKEIVQRVRPCNELPDVLTPLGCNGTFSFPSNHAVNNFAAAFFYMRFFPNLKWAFITAAVLVGISRIYLGLHYPSDIVGGAIIGIILGIFFGWLADKVYDFFNRKREAYSE